MAETPSAAELAAALRRVGEAAIRAGDANRWHPRDVSPTWALWVRGTEDDLLARTILEGEVHGCLLVQSGLQHLLVVADAARRGRPFVPLTVGRTATEHALRALHQLTDADTEDERARRRLLEWLHAAREGERMSSGVGLPRVAGGADPETQTSRAVARAKALGFSTVVTRRKIEINGHQRESTMQLAEWHLAGIEGLKVPSFLMRRHSAMEHGLEIGLLSSVREFVGPLGVNVMTPGPTSPGRLALDLLLVPLAVLAAFQTLRLRYGWDESSRELSDQLREHDRALDLWKRAATAHVDEFGATGD